MIRPVFAIRDVTVGFMNPMVDISEATAKRNFTFAINNPDNGVMNFAPGDYDLYKIGSFDDESGELIPLPVPELIVHGSAVYGVNVK